tara:strand:- start:2010 stop:2483 length:474 start_codon:yes stop_codon:yes gene_type:complete
MKNIKFNLIFIITLIFLYSCAKPTVVEVVMPEDEKLNCEQLKNAVTESKKIRRDAEYAKEGTGGNVARMMLFWPAWARTLHNADIAVQAANDRIYHLYKIMKKKECKKADAVYAEITNYEISKNTISQQLKDLNEMYNSGILTKEEFELAKKKTLDQ